MSEILNGFRCHTCTTPQRVVSTEVESGSRDHTGWLLLLKCGHRIGRWTFGVTGDPTFDGLKALVGTQVRLRWWHFRKVSA